MKLKVKKLHPNAIIPKYQTKGSAGFDIHALISENYADSYTNWDGRTYICIPPKNQVMVKTGLSFVVPDGYEMQIRPRSGLAAKYSITITNSPGTLDSSYRDELIIILHNLGEHTFNVHHGDRIAQCVINKIETVDFEEVKEFSEEDMEKDRKGGFGSTGIK